MRVAVYGGSFNPPHVGHLMVAAWLRWTSQADEVWLLPTFEHPFAKGLVPFATRVAWCEAVAAEVPSTRVCTIEAELPVPSYTIGTLSALALRHPGHELRFVLGADQAEHVHRWKAWREIEARFAPIQVGRQGCPTPEGAIDFPGVSSTDVRARIAAGEPVGHLVPASIHDEVVARFAAPRGGGGG